jgi:type IV pilus assembly protein PilY1
MAEAYRYFDGGVPIAGNGKAKTDYLSNLVFPIDDFPPSATDPEKAAAKAVYDLPGNALQAKAGSPYTSPVADGSCGGNFIIYISNGPNQQSAADDKAADDLLVAAGGNKTPIAISPSGSQSNPSDEWARFMRQSEYGIITYTLDVDRVVNGQGPGWTALLQSMARVSNGRYFDVSSGNGGAEIAQALSVIFSEIQAVNSVFASVSLPLSVNTQGTYLNQVYVGMFRPDADGNPRWYGNLKQYRLGIVANQLVTIDADGQPAINSSTGFITECARSYWTSNNPGYWTFANFQRTCLDLTTDPTSDSPDGNLVEKGAQAQRLRASVARNLRTCVGCAADSTPVAFTTANVTKTMLGDAAMADAEQTSLVSWARGRDVLDEDGDGVTNLESRPSKHGDVVHSRPYAINFGNDVNPEVVVFYGGNDGVLRAINGNRTLAIGAVGAGSELWSFMAPEFIPRIKRLRDNDVPIDYKNNIFPTSAPKPYGFDGAVTAFVDGGETWLYATMRRGGRMLYAFDVSTITDDPNSPTLKWRKGCPNLGDDNGCSAGFDGIGQTWSAPEVLHSGGNPDKVVIVGGGYDTCEDFDAVGQTHNCDNTAKGRSVYVIDADDGTLLNTFTTQRGVAADVSVLKDADGNPQWGYVVDLGGNIYRISGSTPNEPMENADPANWTMTRIASLGCSTVAACNANRKFMFAPDIVVNNSGQIHLLVGSGDREKPLMDFEGAYAVNNYFFMVKDSPLDDEWLSSESGNCSNNDLICLDSLTDIPSDDDADAASLAQTKGWYLELADHEQVVTSPITVYGTVTFSTHTPTVPADGACTSNLGTAKVYNVRYLDAAIRNGTQNRFEVIAGGGLPPSPVAGLVLPDGAQDISEALPFIIGGSPESPLQAGQPEPPPTTQLPKSLTYWYIEK